GLEVRLQAVKRGERDVLGRRVDVPQKIHVPVQVSVIHRVDDLTVQHSVHVPEVDDHAGRRVQGAADGDFDDVVVPVVGDAGPEHLAVLLVAPVMPAQDVRRGECGTPGDAYVRSHGSIRKLAPETGAASCEASQTI